jgi:cell division protein FtsQ
VPNISGHVINIGSADGFENKFAKLMQFYRQVMPKKGWDTYDTISVKWNHQIVATRRVKAVVQTLDVNLEDDEQAPDIETMTVGSADEANRPQSNEPKQAQPNEPKSSQDGKKTDQDNKKDNSKKENNKKSN